jgi:hypothetical protein
MKPGLRELIVTVILVCITIPFLLTKSDLRKLQKGCLCLDIYVKEKKHKLCFEKYEDTVILERLNGIPAGLYICESVDSTTVMESKPSSTFNYPTKLTLTFDTEGKFKEGIHEIYKDVTECRKYTVNGDSILFN